MSKATIKNNENGTVEIKAITVDSSNASAEFSKPTVKTFNQIVEDARSTMLGVIARYEAKGATHGAPMTPKGHDKKVVRISQKWEIPASELSPKELAHNMLLRKVEAVKRALSELAKEMPSNIGTSENPLSLEDVLTVKTC